MDSVTFYQEMGRNEEDVSGLTEWRVNARQMAAEEMMGYIKGSEELSPEMKSCAEDGQKYLSAYFEDLGIEDWNKPSIIMQIDWKKLGIGGAVFGSSRLGHVYIPARITNINPELDNFLRARILFHESYHATAPDYVSAQLDGNGEYQYSLERTALNYAKDTPEEEITESHQGASAIEEGMAMRMELFGISLASKHFPDGAKQYYKILSNNLYQLKPTYRKVSEALYYANVNGEERLMATYAEPYLLIRYLEEVVPDFIELTERARINGESVALARRIESIFGRGSYRKIMTTNPRQAIELLGELQSIVPNSDNDE